MIKQISFAVASLLLVSACSGMHAGQADVGTMGDESSIVSHTGTRDAHGNGIVFAGQSKKVKMLEEELVSKAGNKVHFDFDSASLSKDSQKTLKHIAKFIKNHTGTINSVVIEGHCDERGTREYNLALGDRRAVSVKKYLVGMGVNSRMLRTISYGKERPASSAHNEKAWAENRRAVIVLK